ncbi:hypothetical protein PV05_10325 [Exophiala xenobiotica]|uniref:Ubiquitin-like domain-containing protein n=1 Tax=Exophiala xenobiotica TaxID=348802 RepID=A0A0D2BHA8_9EURO|nr:uncharacterized protein PV05_10325 [Exophiala xenobiotica]KIW51621.1 hypothetical protein PV05_10325 [Exophiala xenobiotica]
MTSSLTGQHGRNETWRLCDKISNSLADVHQATQDNRLQNLDISDQVRATTAPSETRSITNLQMVQQTIADHLHHGQNSTFASPGSVETVRIPLSQMQSASNYSETAEFSSDSSVGSVFSTSPFRTLDNYIDENGPISLAQEILQQTTLNDVRLVEQMVVPSLLVAFYIVDSPRRLEISPRGSALLLVGNLTSLRLLLTAMAALIRLLCPVERPISLLGGGYVNFEDAFGRLLKLPFTTCQYPTIFFRFLREHFKDSPVHEYMRKDLYHLNLDGSRGILITRQTWSSLVRPKGRISMSIIVTLGFQKCRKCTKTLYRHGNDLHW